MNFRVLKETSDLRLGALGPIFVAVWFREATVPAFELLLTEQQTLAKEHGQVTYVAVALEVPHMPSKEVNDWMKAKGDFGGLVLGTVITDPLEGVARGLRAQRDRRREPLHEGALHRREVVARRGQGRARIEGQSKWVAELTTLESDLEAFVALPRAQPRPTAP